MQITYIAAIVISLFYLILIMTLYNKHISAYYILLCVSIILISLGYWQICKAESIEVALVGNQLVYLSASFVTFFMLHCISELCHIKIPTPVNFLCVMSGLFTFGCVMSVGKSDLYYRSIQLIKVNGVSFLEKEYGPLHIVYPISVIMMLIYGFGMVIYALCRKKETSRFSSIMSLLVMTVATGVYLTERLLQLKMELMPIAYSVCFGIILAQLDRVKMYDLRGFSGDEMVSSESLGFVLLANDGKFEGADQFARRSFPELNDIRVDDKIKGESTAFIKQLKLWISHEDTDLNREFECNGRYIEACYSEYFERFSGRIHSIRLRDKTAEKQYQLLIEQYNNELENEVRAKTERITRVQNDIILGMASIVENRDNNTGGHIQRTSKAVRIFARHLLQVGYEGMTPELSLQIQKAAPLHDFGKIAIPDVILNKPGRFSPEEYKKMKEHSEKGASIVSNILLNVDDTYFSKVAVNIAHYHHERWDGLGYPCNLSGVEIPFEARIMALADVFDALVSKRVYKERYSYEKAFSIIRDASGSQFDPGLCNEFLKCRVGLEKLYNSFESNT